jgi:hypothetical protein
MGTTPPSDLLIHSQRPPRSLPSSDDYVPIRRDDFKRLQTHFHQRLVTMVIVPTDEDLYEEIYEVELATTRHLQGIVVGYILCSA